ncbi:DEAD/DEAH box helicase [Shewanella sp. KCT]|uniref:DEAD/DEAH box helicase n=1 Tax=Shewanella sp. KCT TaxID=2569535 RepID=UPI0011830197|nr:DEAD/DEAH box helicase [Shewanella sp. KCT]TVP09300.1 hypothetical protein AYI87_20180 [Shewanella sp. KCT]
MSNSKSPKSESVASNSGFSGKVFYKNIVPSKIFDVSNKDRYPLVQPELNRKIAKLTNPKTLNYTTDIAKIMKVLRDREIVEYQQRLMEAAIDNISEDTVDIDYIRIGLNLTITDIEKLLDEENGLIRVKTQVRQQHLTVETKGVGNKNIGFKKTDKKPFFTKRFIIFANDDDYRCINILIAEPENQRNVDRKLKHNCEIEYIPTRVSNQLASFLLYQLCSVLESRRYSQLMRNALLLELHTGYIMYGVSQLFGFMLTKNDGVKKRQVYPEEREMAVETTYVGSYEGNHLIGYDKTLKENKKFIEKALVGWGGTFERIAKYLPGIEEWFPNQVCSYRIESRCRYDNKNILMGMSPVNSLLSNVRIIRPRRLFELDDKELELLLTNKGIDQVRNTLNILYENNVRRNESGKRNRLRFFWINKRKLNGAVSGRANKLFDAIANPHKDVPVFDDSYSNKVKKIRKRLVKKIKEKLTHSDPIPSIVRAEQRAIYVEGCPGSGKTRLIVKRVKHLLQQGVQPSEISVLAFTNKAKEEFEERLKSLSLYSNDMYIDTFSRWCNQLLNTIEDAKVLNEDKADALIKTLIKPKSKIAKKYAVDDISRRCLTIFSHMANFDNPILSASIKKIAPDMLSYEDDILVLQNSYEIHKKGKLRDFNDMLFKMRVELENTEFLQYVINRTKHLIIDEVQDTNIVQWKIIKTLYDHGIHIFCVGDPAQSMYGFRGANRSSLANFTKSFNNSKRFQLTNNHRSTEPLVLLANEVRRLIDKKSLISFEQRESTNEAKPRFKCSDTLQDAIDWLVSDIERNNCAKTQLILCRYNDHCDDVKEALKKAKIRHGEGANIQVLTYHKGKGMEAEHCYVLDPKFSKMSLSSYTEELCNTYVALTRAKTALTILACNGGSSNYGADKITGRRTGKNIFLDLPEDLLDIVE